MREIGDRVVGHDRFDPIGLVRGHEQADDRAFREAERTDAVLIDLGICTRRIEYQREVAARLPGKHASAVLSFDPTFVVGGDRDVSAGREIPDDSVHVRGRPFFLRKNENGGERAYAGGARALDVHPEIAAGKIGRPDGHVGSRLARMNQIVIRPRATHEQNHADSESGWRETTDTPAQSWCVVSVDLSRREGWWSMRSPAARLAIAGEHETVSGEVSGEARALRELRRSERPARSARRHRTASTATAALAPGVRRSARWR